MPQTENVFASMTVEDNLALAAAVLPQRERRARIERDVRVLPRSGAAAPPARRAGSPAASGRCWRSPARCMVEPKLLMLDEASAGLSPKLVELVFAKLRRSGKPA